MITRVATSELTHVIVSRDWVDYLIGFGSLIFAVVAVVIAVRAQRSVASERRKVFELSVLTRIVETYSQGLGNYQADNVVTRLLDVLPAEDLPTLRNWYATSPRTTTAPVDATITQEYREAVQRRTSPTGLGADAWYRLRRHAKPGPTTHA